MEAVVFVGIQGAGKSTFYRDRFFATHMRINLDMLKTRHRERLFLACYLDALQPFVVDNTNATKGERQVYLDAARERNFRVVGYYFQSRVDDCIKRNAARSGKAQVPDRAIQGTAARMEMPERSEGFDELWYVRIDERGQFVVEAWRDEV